MSDEVKVYDEYEYADAGKPLPAWRVAWESRVFYVIGGYGVPEFAEHHDAKCAVQDGPLSEIMPEELDDFWDSATVETLRAKSANKQS